MKTLAFAVSLACLATSVGAAEDLKLAEIFTDHAVLQRDRVLPVWGTAKPGSTVSVTLGARTSAATADYEGHWVAKLRPQKASNLSMVLRVACGDEKIVRTDILLGDVWHASGQSNMAMTVGAAARSLETVREAAANAELQTIRFTRLTAGPSTTPLDQLANPAKWTRCTPETVKSFSAAAFFFARKLHTEVGVPIGIIDSSRGGTPIEPFIPPAAFQGHPTLEREAELAELNDLSGIWQLPGGVRARDENWMPGRLFNSRIAPVKQFTVAGCIWYQGESNCGKREDPRHYRYKMRALIDGWRNELGQSLPFYFVQLPGSGAGTNWPYLREQQRLASIDQKIGRVGMAVTIDLEHPDIHPPNKIAVGERLARWALFEHYRKPIQPIGPVLSKVRFEGPRAIVAFDAASFGLRTSPDANTPIDKPKHFELLDRLGTWHAADARIVDSTVHVTADAVIEPIAVRYAYAVAPEGCNLFNTAGLPASPFCSHPEFLTSYPDIPSSPPLVIAHRGASKDAPENTLAAFNLAFELGADGIKADFRLTKDGEIVCIHDPDTKRVAEKNLVVAESTMAELMELDVGGWKNEKFQDEYIPTLRDVIHVIPRGKTFVIELKVGPEIIAPLKEVLEHSRVFPEQCLIVSSKADTIAEAKRQLPAIKAHWLSAHKFDEKTKTWSPTPEEVIETLRRTGADGFGSRAEHERFDAEFIDKLRLAGFEEFHVWTVNDTPIAQHYRELGTWGIVTDRPGYIRQNVTPLYVAKPVTRVGEFTSGIEGPACDRFGTLYAVNFQRQGTIGRVDENGQVHTFARLPKGSIGNGLRFNRDGDLLVADYTNHNILRVDRLTQAVTVHAQNENMNQPNDLAITSDGTLFASDPNWTKGTGQLWRIDPDGTTKLLAKDMGTTNGIEVSPDEKTLYVNESKQRNIWAFTINEDKSLSNKRLFKRFPDFSLDGMRCDIDGNLYVTRHGKGTVAKLSPTGDVLREIKLPGTKPSNICFGGPDGRTAFVTEVDNTQIVSFRVEKPGLTRNLSELKAAKKDDVVRVFIFAGQSNMVGSDSKIDDVYRFPPFDGLQDPQPDVKFSYCIGRENKLRSRGWVNLAAVNNVVGPELSFARKVSQNIDAPIAIIKCAAGGTHLGGDWNPDTPLGFKMYPLALDLVRSSLAELDKQGIRYRIEGFMWHQGENDMFEKDYMPAYGKNLANFLASWRRDLETPDLKFYIGELCCKTIWGMDLRPRMYAISKGQREVTDADKLAEYIPTSHVGVEIGGGVGLHYHYGTLGQLEHGVNYADAYLRTIGKLKQTPRKLVSWPYADGSKVKLFVLAGHRNMEGERAFVDKLGRMNVLNRGLAGDNHEIAYKYSIGGGYKVSNGWEPLGPAGFYDTFGPELSFADTLSIRLDDNLAIAKFTHSGTQMNDWTPEGSEAKFRNIYPKFIQFIKESVAEIEARGHEVELTIWYHVGENDMSFGPYRGKAADRLKSTVQQSRKDLGLPNLKWLVSQQKPTNDKSVNAVQVTTKFERLARQDPNLFHIKAFYLPPQEKKLVLDTQGIVSLGRLIAEDYVRQINASE